MRQAAEVPRFGMKISLQKCQYLCLSLKTAVTKICSVQNLVWLSISTFPNASPHETQPQSNYTSILHLPLSLCIVLMSNFRIYRIFWVFLDFQINFRLQVETHWLCMLSNVRAPIYKPGTAYHTSIYTGNPDCIYIFNLLI